MTMTHARFYTAASAALVWAAVAAGQSIITSLAPAEQDRSGRLRIYGSGFGSAKGAVTIDGMTAFVTTWESSFITAYVPESASLGPVAVRVVVNGIPSDPAMLTVNARQPDGRVKWRFAFDEDLSYHRCGVAPDGSVYLHDQHARLYKLSPDGALIWIVDTLFGAQGLGIEGPVEVGDDGTVYLISDPLGPEVWLQAFNPDGTLLWQVVEPTAFGAAAGPAIGPDNNIYAVFHYPTGPGLGAVCVSPGGTLLWNNTGNPPLYEHGSIGSELSFASPAQGQPVDRVVVTVDRDSDRYLYAFRMAGGQQLFAVPAGVVEDPIMQFQMVAAAGSGNAYLSEFVGLGGLGWGLQAFSAANGSRTWRFDPGIASGLTNPTVAFDGTIYIAWDLSRVSAVSPAGAEIWRHNTGGITNNPPMPDPENEIVILSGKPTFGVPGWIKALNAADGSLLWTVDLPMENGGSVVPDASARFSPDRSTAYVPTTILGQDPNNEYGYLYAIETGLGACYPDCDQSGSLDLFDFLCFTNAFNGADPYADCDGSGLLDLFDFLCFTNEFNAGCP